MPRKGKGKVLHVKREQHSKNMELGNSVGFLGNAVSSFLEFGVTWGEGW